MHVTYCWHFGIQYFLLMIAIKKKMFTVTVLSINELYENLLLTLETLLKCELFSNVATIMIKEPDNNCDSSSY